MKLIELILNHSSFSRNSALEEGKEINIHTLNSHKDYLYAIFIYSI